MNNKYQTNEELADIARKIMSEDLSEETGLAFLVSFFQNMDEMKGLLLNLQDILKNKASADQKHSRLMGDGTAIMALNASKKLDIQLSKLKDDSTRFIRLAKEALK